MPGGIQVLYVDDEPGLLEVAQIFLEQSGEFRVGISTSALDALSNPSIRSYDAIVSDYQMPGMDGIAFLKAVRERFGEIPFILFTGRGREEVVIDAINNGADFYLQKGGDPRAQFAELSHKIRQAVSRKRAQEELKAAYEQITASEEELREQYGEIKAGQQKLQESQHQLAEIAATIPGVMYQFYARPDGSMGFYYVSSRAREVFGISNDVDQFFGTFYARVDPRDRTVLLASIREAVSKGSPWEREGRFIKPSGEMIWFQEMARPVKMGSELVYNGVLLDITRRKQADETIAESARRLKEAQEMAHLGFWSWDIKSGNVEWSEEVFRIFCLDPRTFRPMIDSILAQSPWPEEQQRGKELIRKATESHEAGEYEQRFLRPDGSIGYYHSTYQGRYDETGDLSTIVGTVLDITERKRAEEEHKKSEDRFRDIIENSPYGMHFYELDSSGNLIFTGANPAADRILKISHRQFIGKTIGEVFPGLEGTEIPGRYREVAESGRVWQIENTIYDKGSIRGVYDVIAFRTASASMTAMFVDITERKQMEAALRESEEKFRTIFDQAHDAFAVFSEGVCTDCNRYALDLFGYPAREEILGLRPYDLSPPRQPDGRDTKDLADAHAREALEKGSAHFEWIHKKRDGSPFLADILLSSFELGGKRVIISSIRDITEKKRMEDALRANEERLTLALDATNDVLFDWDMEKDVSYYSPQYFTMLGYAQGELETGLSAWADLLHPDDRERALAMVEEYRNGTRDSHAIEFRLRAKNGEWKWIFSRAKITGRNADGKPVRMVGIHTDITVRKQFEEALKVKNEEIDRYFNTSLDMFCIADTDGNFRRLNPEWERTLGYTIAELQEHRFLDFVHPEDLDATLATVADLSHQKEILNFTNRYRHKDGSYRWLEWRSFPMGKMIFAAARDITGRRQMEEALRTREELLRLFIRHAPAALAMFDTEMRYLAASRRWMADYHLGDRDILGRSHYEIFPEIAEELKTVHHRGLAGEVVSSNEDRFVRRDGSVQWLAWEVRPWYTVGNSIGGIIIFSEEITERKKAEEALRESEEKYRSLVEKATEAIAIVQDMRVVYANPRMAALVGIPEQNLIGMAFLDMTWPDDREILRIRHLERMAGKDVPDTIEFRVTGPGGKPRWIHASTGMIHWLGRPATLNLMTDITERMLAEAALREANRKLGLLNSITRHDIRNQLTKLQGFAQIAVMKEDDPGITAILTKINDGASTIRQQIEFMKTYQELGDHTPGWVRLDKAVAKETTGEIAVSCFCNNIEIFADPMLEKVFFNLFDNAVRHGHHVTEMVVRCEPASDGILIIVEDNGIGIPDYEKEQIFEKGYGKNTGLGLFLVREILSITGMTIRECGVSGKGARFEIAVPKDRYRVGKYGSEQERGSKVDN